VSEFVRAPWFTPGPWIQRSNEIIGAAGTKHAFVVCKLACGTQSPAETFSYLDEKQAHHTNIVHHNAALISAAPDLYAALAMMVASRGQGEITAAATALEKARGK